MQVLRRHRLIETFLVEVMKLDWAEVHEEAEVLEHVVSDCLLKRMDVMLHHPTHDPHGSPIPSPEGKITHDGTAILADCQPGCYILKRVREDQPGFLQWLSDLKLLPGTEFVLSSVNSMAGTLSLTLEEDEEVIEISNSASRSLLVVKVD
jgi:DtxR family Mn-dependent transcriptional regulator